MAQVPPPPAPPPGGPEMEWPPPPPPPATPEAGPAVPWTAWDLALTLAAGLAFGLLLTVLAFLPLGLSGAEPSQPVQVGIASVAIYIAVGVSGWFFALKRRGASFADAGVRWVGIRPLLLAIPLALGLMFATALVIQVMSGIVGDVPTAREQVAPGEARLVPADLFWLLLAGAVMAPIVEEFYFRGLLFRYLRVRTGLWAAVFGSAILFGLLHLVPPLIPALVVFGVIQALVAHHFESIYPAIVLHALNNAVLLVTVYSFLS